MNKQEALDELDKKGRQFFQAATDLKIESNTRNVASGVFSGISVARSVLAQLDEPQKVKVPAIVAKWIKWNKNKGGSVFILFDIDKAMAFEAHQNDKRLIDWMIDHRNHDFLIRAWLDDYEIEEEPEWVVKHNDDFYIEDLVKVQGKKHAKTFGSESEAQKWAELCSGTVEKV